MKIARWIAFQFFFLSFIFVSRSVMAVEWPPVSPEELSMTSLKEQPGASAVILDRQETDDDMNNAHELYERIKILTDAGRDYANVEIPYSRRGFSIGGISGRTIHADGTIIPFDGKPFDKTVIKGGGVRINVKSFTLPDVQVGSIIDFRYSLRYDDNRVLPPFWEVQNELFQRKAYFKFIPFQNHGNVDIILDHNQISTGIAWQPFIGNGTQPQLHNLPYSSSATVHTVSYWVDLSLKDVPAFVEEPYMPPASLLKWRVYFYYQQNLEAGDYWKAHGKFWNKDVEGFVGHNRGVAEAVAKAVSPSDSPEQKVRKIYAFVGSLENQDYIPERTAQEQKVLELKDNKGADDVLEHRSGTHDDLNRLFVAMVRAAAIPASMMLVPDRSHEIFIKQVLSMSQFDAEIAVVQLGGKDVFLDPGTKFCPYGIIDWRYTGITGLRQTEKGAEIAETPPPQYRDSISTRRADVALNQQGILEGTVALVFKGTAAMSHRQEAGKTDAQGRKKLLEDELREMLPGNAEIRLLNSPDWDNPETPLIGQFYISCPFAVAAGKRLMLSEHLFQFNEKSRFAAEHRSNAVYFNTPWQEADEVFIKLPPGMEVESLAPNDLVKLPYAVYQVQQKLNQPDQVYSRRDFIMGQALFTPNEYPGVKGFFDKVKNDDDQPTLVRLSPRVATSQ